MDFRQVNYFVCLYEEQNVSRAARRLNVVQPAVSAQIRKLEAELGVRLFERNSRGVTPTAAGRVFHQLCLPVARDFGSLRQRMRDLSGDAAGEISVGLVPSITSSVLADVLGEFTAAFPRVLVRAAEAYSGMLVDGVVSGKLDLAVTNNLGEMPGLVVQHVITEDLVLVTGRRPKPRPGRPVSPDALARMRLVLPSRQHGLRMLAERYFSAEGLRLAPGLELDALAPVLHLVETSAWATILPVSAVRRAADAGRVSIWPFADHRLKRELVLVHRMQHPLSLAAERFVQLLARRLEAVAEPGARDRSEAVRRA